MINELLNQIIELDKKTNNELLVIDQEVQQVEIETQNKIRNIENSVLSATKSHCQRHYDEKVKEAEEIKERTIEEARLEATELIEIYNSVKDQAASEFLNLLFTNNNE